MTIIAEAEVGFRTDDEGPRLPQFGREDELGGKVLRALAWQKRALCRGTDPDAFFPEQGGSTREAKRVCGGCEVRLDCLKYALEYDERFGIWGGLGERERRKIKRRV